MYLKGLLEVVEKGNGMIYSYADHVDLFIKYNFFLNIETYSLVNLASFNQFFNNHNLLVNKEKTNFVLLTANKNKTPQGPQIFLDDSLVNQIESIQILGFTIDKN